MDRSRIGIVIPALNESLTIENIVKTVVKYGLPIVVDDGSVDDTSKLAVSAGAVVVSHLQNCGYDCALNSGFKKADELGMISGNNLLFKSKIENIYRYLKITGISGVLHLAGVIISQIRYKF